MPRLHTLACQPMHPCRLLTKSPTAYPITAQLLSSGIGSIGSNITQKTHALLHLGLRMPGRPRNPKFELRRFYYADTDDCSALPKIGLEYLPKLFPELTHLDLCISMTKSRKDLHELRKFIMAAKCLTHLRLCFERSYYTRYEIGPLLNNGSYVVLSHPEFHLPKLRYLHVTDTRIPPHRLLRVVKKHAKTLRCLRLDENMPTTIIKTFVNMVVSDEIKLDDLVIMPSNTEDHSFLEFNDSFKDGDILRDGTLQRYSVKNKFAYIRGDGLRYGTNTWRTAAIIDSRRPVAWIDYPDEIELLDIENGDSRNDPIEVREHTSHIKRLSESPWWVYEDIDGGKLEPVYQTDGRRVVVRRHDEGIPLFPTQIWRFQHRNGEVAFADDPLEYWEDWEGSEAGDSSVPTSHELDGGLFHLLRMELLSEVRYIPSRLF
ncbi:hypothetical protein F4805DRAFT_475970 [Annulohypoxylon moriforme]|nr:hypothetical protein F4805DRAFT_475970 [Annulohypoxylon moriforme]